MDQHISHRPGAGDLCHGVDTTTPWNERNALDVWDQQVFGRSFNKPERPALPSTQHFVWTSNK